MSLYQIAVVVLRCSGLVYFASAVKLVTYLPSFSAMSSPQINSLTENFFAHNYKLAFLRLALDVVFGIVFLACAKPIARLVTRDLTDKS